jgi:hypothetical protein
LAHQRGVAEAGGGDSGVELMSDAKPTLLEQRILAVLIVNEGSLEGGSHKAPLTRRLVKLMAGEHNFGSLSSAIYRLENRQLVLVNSTRGQPGKRGSPIRAIHLMKERDELIPAYMDQWVLDELLEKIRNRAAGKAGAKGEKEIMPEPVIPEKKPLPMPTQDEIHASQQPEPEFHTVWREIHSPADEIALALLDKMMMLIQNPPTVEVPSPVINSTVTEVEFNDLIDRLRIADHNVKMLTERVNELAAENSKLRVRDSRAKVEGARLTQTIGEALGPGSREALERIMTEQPGGVRNRRPKPV